MSFLENLPSKNLCTVHSLRGRMLMAFCFCSLHLVLIKCCESKSMCCNFLFLYCVILIHSLQKALHALNYNLYPVMEPSEGQVLLCVALMNHYFCTCFVHLIKRTCFAPVICLVTLVPCMQTEKVIISRWSFSHSACSWALQQRVLLVAPCCHYTLFLFVVKCCLQTINSLSFNVQELALILCKYCKKIWNITITDWLAILVWTSVYLAQESGTVYMFQTSS